DREGCARAIDAEHGISLMANIRDAGLDDLLALCGGCLSCATCHVYVEGAATACLEPMSSDEDDQLYSSGHRRSGARLDCQIVVTVSFSGFSAESAPED